MKNDTVYHITFSCYHRYWLFKSPHLYELLLERIETVRIKYGFKVYAYVVMPNHVHLILNIEHSIIGKVLSSIKRPFSFHALKYLRDKFPDLHQELYFEYGSRKGYRFWQAGGGSINEIRTDIQLTKTLEYVHSNPVKRELAKHPGEWSWSSYKFWEKGENRILNVEKPEFLR